MTLADVTNLRIESYSDHPEVYAFAEWLVDDYMSGKQRVKDKAEYIRTARKLIASLWVREGDLFKFTTRAENFGKSRKQVWMSKKVLKLFEHLVSIQPMMIRVVAKGRAANITKNGKGMNTVYCRTLAFKERLKELTVNDVIPNPDLPRIELRNDKKQLLPIDDQTISSSWYARTTKTLTDHFDLICSSNITTQDGSPLSSSDVFYIRKFKNDFYHGGRLYANYENWSKRSRLGIHFDGEPAISLDISQLHPSLIMRLFYRTDKEPVGMLRGELKDAYDLPEYNHLPRSVHKKLVNTLFNSVSEDSALRSIMTAHLQLKTDDWGEQEYFCKAYKGRSTRKGVKIFKDDKAGALKYLNYFKLIHPYYAAAIGSGLGSELQRLDSDYVMEVLRLCTELKCPVLPVHDEFVFPLRWLPTMEIVLQRAFQSVFKDIGSIGTLVVTATLPDNSESRIHLPLY